MVVTVDYSKTKMIVFEISLSIYVPSKLTIIPKYTQNWKTVGNLQQYPV